jgi:ATP-dependent RNA helicase RhlE
VGIAQTGTGKTAAFALPMLHRLASTMRRGPDGKPRGLRKVRVLILASTRELALQIHESFQTYGEFAGLKIAVIYGGVGQQPQVNALRSGAEIVVATPGRLLDLIGQGHVRFDGLETLVLDEADRMLDMGFFPAIRRILTHLPKQRQTLLFSATMKPEIRDLADSMLHDPVSITIEPKKKTTELVDQSVCFVPQKQKTRLLIELLRRYQPERTIVFSRTKHGADRIVRHLTSAGMEAEAIHANKSQNRRQRTLEAFKSERPPILVATDIAARGIDVDNVSHVFLHDLPTEEETYVHRIGRSGRAGATGISVTLCDPDERRMLRSIEKLIGQPIPVQTIDGFDFAVPDEPAQEQTRRGALDDPRRPDRVRGRRRGDASHESGRRHSVKPSRGPHHRHQSTSTQGRRPHNNGPSTPAPARRGPSILVSPGQRPESQPPQDFGDGLDLVSDHGERRPSAEAGRPARRRRRRPARTAN